MGEFAAKEGDRVKGADLLFVMVPVGSSELPVPLSHEFSGPLKEFSGSVNIMGKPAATVKSKAENQPKYLPKSPGTRFLTQPTDVATIVSGSTTVRINGEAALRHGDPATTGNGPGPTGTVVADGTVRIG